MTALTSADAAAGTLSGRPVSPRTTVAVPALTYWRVRRTMLQRELAERTGLHLRHVQRLEAGGRAGLDTVRKLAAALDVDPNELRRQPPAS